MRKKIPVILDVDTGIDDGVAIILAAKCPKIDIKLVVTCHGNTTIKNITKNTLFILEKLKRFDIPVAEGMASPLLIKRPHVSAHGADGLGGYQYENPGFDLLKESALEATHKILSESQEKITYICLAPSTNIANLLKEHPEDADKIQEIVIMVGSNEPVKDGETPYKEFNASVDPEALSLVLDSKIKKTIVSMEMGHTAYLNWKDVYKTEKTNAFGEMLENIFRGYKDYHVRNGIATHDGCTVAYVIDPTMFETREGHMQVRFFEKLGSGVGVIDYDKTPNVTITTKINIKKFKKLYFKTLKKCKI
ncbi:MAG: nucleoside hydrolase [Clostridia bacterium]|nr:nucleoside hydrolase [Clostridia bacterium]